MPPVPDGIPEQDQELIRSLLAAKPPEFTDLTKTQYEAFSDGVLGDGNHLLIAETGNGKTFVAEALTRKRLQSGNTVAYLVPSKALVGEKHETLTDWISDGKTVNQGYGYGSADCIVATFESFFEAMIRGYAGRFDSVVLDDFHELYSDHRGGGIEKAISASLDKSQEILAVSATVGNPETVARWMDADLTISSEERAVPIEERPVEKTDEKYAKQLARLLRKHSDKGPFLIFNDTTSNAAVRAKGIAQQVSFDVPAGIDWESEVESRISTELTDSHKELIELLESGIAYHHSRLAPGIKELIEEYTEQGVIKCVSATTTLSYGFDSPIQSVIVADLKRWTGNGISHIGVHEYTQMIGRAGRYSERYDQAYAFPMWDDDESVEVFQFDTPVEDKELEDIESHLSGREALRWLILELVNYGWETDSDVLEFVKSTLFWSETVDQIPDHMRDDLGFDPTADIKEGVSDTFEWLSTIGAIKEPMGQPQSGATRYNSTELGSALVEYFHSNWYDDTVSEVLELSEWLADQGDELTPERLVQRLAIQYYHCDLGIGIDPVGEFGETLDRHDLSGSEGMTAAISCWMWCAGMPVGRIEDELDVDDLTGLTNTMSNTSQAVESVGKLYTPFEMPDELEWLDTFSKQIETGVPGPDMVLVSNVDYFGRGIYHNLRDRLDGANASWDPGPDHFLIERLSKLLAERGDGLFCDTLRDTRYIGDAISENILSTVTSWDPDGDTFTPVPYAESVRSRDQSAELLGHRQSSDVTATDGGDSDVTQTGLDDF
jgi:superfamily II DNA or RNA helicase